MKSKSTTTEPDEPRDRHGHNRGVPPPPVFDFDALADGTLLSELETAAVLRLSTNTLTAWRQRNHSLQWLALPNGYVRYLVRDIRAFLSLGQPRKRKPAPSPAGAATTTAEIHTKEDAAPPRRRARRAKADDVPATQEQA